MKHLVLFENFAIKYREKRELPSEGLMEVRDPEELEALFRTFRKRGYVEGYRNERSTVEAWITQDWSEIVPSNERVYFQWVPARPSVSGSKDSIYCQSMTPREAREHEDVIPVYNFDDYFELKPEFRGHKLKKYSV